MLGALARGLFGTANDRIVKGFDKPVAKINALEPEYEKLSDAELRAKTAQVTVRFVSQLVSVTHDRNGAVIEGSPEKVTEVTDVWTFARDLSSRDPNWKLVATEAGQ